MFRHECKCKTVYYEKTGDKVNAMLDITAKAAEEIKDLNFKIQNIKR